jgi:hypothetical protein
VRATLGLRGGLELEWLWASTLATPTELASSLLLYLDTLVELLFHAMRQLWSYAWVLYPHHILELLVGKPWWSGQTNMYT